MKNLRNKKMEFQIDRHLHFRAIFYGRDGQFHKENTAPIKHSIRFGDHF